MRRAATALLLLLAAAPASAQEELRPRRYGDRGTSHVGLALGLGTVSGGFYYLAGAEYAYFVYDGIAPGAEVQVSGGSTVRTTGLALGTLHLVPLRTDYLSLFVIGRGGRVLLADHGDGWGVGAGAGIIFFMSGNIGLRIGYDRLELFPRSFCADLVSCHIDGLQVGIVAGF